MVRSSLMYALAIIRYRKPLEEVQVVTPEHRAYLGRLRDEGILIASGPLEPRSGGALLLRVPEGADVATTLDSVRDGDPYVKRGMAQYELLPWAPGIGREELDQLGPP